MKADRFGSCAAGSINLHCQPFRFSDLPPSLSAAQSTAKTAKRDPSPAAGSAPSFVPTEESALG